LSHPHDVVYRYFHHYQRVRVRNEIIVPIKHVYTYRTTIWIHLWCHK